MSMFAEIVLAQKLEAMTRRAETAEAALAERDKPCTWTLDCDGWYATSCKDDFFEKYGDFCPNCGHPIEVQP